MEENKAKIDDIKVIESKIQVINFEDKLADEHFAVQIQCLGPAALYIWIGQSQALTLQNLNASIPTTQVQSMRSCQ